VQRFSRFLLVKRRQARRAAPGRSRRQRAGLGGLGLGLLLALALPVILLAGGAAYASATADLPNPALLEGMLDPVNGSLLQPTRLYDRTGQRQIAALENPGVPRRYLRVDPDQPQHIDPRMVNAFVALHDPNFWAEPGFRWPALLAPQPQTIPERLVDDLLLREEGSGWRKSLRLRLLAAQVVSQYGHAQVLEWYLNSAYFGHLAYGVDNAARLYFGKSAANLTLAESALLAAVAQSPALNPLDAPAAARELQPAALERMRIAGQISAADYRSAAAESVRFAAELPPADPPAQAFAALVVQELTGRFDRRWMERGGLRITTTLDLDLQAQLSCATQAQLARLSDAPATPADCAAARLLPTLNRPALPGAAASAVILDAKTGEVLALTGDSTALREGSLLDRHPAGTLLAPISAVSAFARGLSPAVLLWDVPPADGSLSTPQNPDGSYHGPVRLRTALANDYWLPLEQLTAQVGLDTVRRTAQSLGLESLSSSGSGPSLFAGFETSPLELAQAYNTLATLGLRVAAADPATGQIQPALIRSVVDRDGRVWLEHPQPDTLAVLSQPLAYLVHHVLSDEPARWPALGYPNPLEIGRPAGAKAGRTPDGRTAWAAGYSPSYTVVVWMGTDGDQPVDPIYPAGIWHALMQYLHRDLPSDNWAVPPGVTFRDVCDPSGLLPTADCPVIVPEVFVTGNEPNAYDSLYRAYQINRETGQLATVFTPPELVDSQVFLVVPPEARAWARQAGLPAPPTGYDRIQAANLLPDVQISSPGIFRYVSGTVQIRGTAAGEDFSSYRLQAGEGLNPQAWIQIGDEGARPVQNGLLGEWDTTGEDGLYALRLLVIRADYSVESAVIQVTVDNQPPEVTLLYPAPGEMIDPGSRSTLTLQATASDGIGIQRLTWWVDGKRVGETLQPPYSLAWPAAPGEHTLQVRAVDLAGNETRSPDVRFIVR
jgi:membrane peptidoglycan carboxypeptidase